MAMIRTALLIIISLTTFAATAKDSSEYRDPTRPWNYQKPSAQVGTSRLQLTEIRMTPSSRQAVINGQRLKVGERINGFQVIHIERGHVVLRNQESEQKLSLVKTVRKTQ